VGGAAVHDGDLRLAATRAHEAALSAVAKAQVQAQEIEGVEAVEVGYVRGTSVGHWHDGGVPETAKRRGEDGRRRAKMGVRERGRGTRRETEEEDEEGDEERDEEGDGGVRSRRETEETKHDDFRCQMCFTKCTCAG
jgi:hypothetical protein